jgi:hypothetical protein
MASLAAIVLLPGVARKQGTKLRIIAKTFIAEEVGLNTTL